MNPLFARLGIPQDIDTLPGLTRLVNEGIAETPHLDFKRQVNDIDELADDLAAMVNTGGGVLVIGVGTDKADRASSLHEHPLKTIEQQAVQAARNGIDEPLQVEPIPIPSATDASCGYLVVAVSPSDRTPHITSKRGRILHRVGTHNKPMTRREVGAAFAAFGETFALEFGLAQSLGKGTVTCELTNCIGGQRGDIKITNAGSIPATNISIESSVTPIRWAANEPLPQKDWILGKYIENPGYLPIKRLPPGADVVFSFERDWNLPSQDIIRIIWNSPDGQVHCSEQSWSWRPR
jgi:Putative DNA-binding domain